MNESSNELEQVKAGAFSPSHYVTEYGVWQSTLIGLCLSAVILFSIGGNVLVCIAILTHRKLKKVSNLFLISLAIADLVVSSLVMPFAVANDILGYWPFAAEFCSIWISFDILSATASILNLCAISLDRYLHMKNPFTYDQWMTNRKCLLFITLIWTASILISFLPINLGWHKAGEWVENSTVSPQNLTHRAEVPLCYLELNPLYATISSSVSFYLPCIVMVAIYIKIYKLARFHAKSIKKTQSFDYMNGIHGTKSKLSENKALFTLGMIMGLFLLSWIPFFIVNLVSSFCKCVPSKIFVAFTWLGYCNSTMNPIIYSKFNADFREAFKKILCCYKCRDIDPYASSFGKSESLMPFTRSANGHSSKLGYESSNGNLNNNNENHNEAVELQLFLREN